MRLAKISLLSRTSRSEPLAEATQQYPRSFVCTRRRLDLIPEGDGGSADFNFAHSKLQVGGGLTATLIGYG
jgi:hypothetical protein